MSAKVIVACGSGVATSQTVASKIDRLLKEARINADVQAVDLKSVDRHLEGRPPISPSSARPSSATSRSSTASPS